MKIAVIIDRETHAPEDPNFEGTHDPLLWEVEFHVIEALRQLGHKVHPVVLEESVQDFMEKIRALKPGLVFNLTEHFQGDRHKDANIAAMLELLHIPFTGASSKGLAICRDKALCKRILSHRVRAPGFITWPVGGKRTGQNLKFPVIVKPMLEDGSDGISLASLVRNEEELEERVRILHDKVKGPAICEEYIEGREMYVGVLGNAQLTVLPPREVTFGRTGPGAPLFATSRVKLDERYRKKWEIEFINADVTPALLKRITTAVKRVYRLLYLRDYGRIDLRITENDEIYFLEANPNPDLTMGDELAEAGVKAGIDYEALVGRIVRHAVKRRRIGQI